MTKVILLDIDGTICDPAGKIPKTTAVAIAAARKAGNLVYLNTRRSTIEVAKPVWELGFDGIISGGGNFVKSGDRVIYHRPLAATAETAIVDWLRRHQAPFYLETNAGFLADAESVAALQAVPATDLIYQSDLTPLAEVATALYRSDVNKICFRFAPQMTVAEVEEAFPAQKLTTWGIKDGRPVWGELRPLKISKARAVVTLLSHLNLTLNDVVVIGDDVTDVPLFQLCETSVCMGNGSPAAKAAADYVTAAVDDDGLAEAFAKLELVGPVKKGA